MTIIVIIFILIVVSFIRWILDYRKNYKNYVTEFMSSKLPMDKLYFK